MEQARALGDRLLEVRAIREQAEADEVLLIAELAEAYVLPAGAEQKHTHLVDALAEEVYPYGGPDAPYISEFAALEIGAMLGISKRKASTLIQGAVHLKWQVPWLMDQVQDLQIEARRAVHAAYVVMDLPERLKQVALQRWVRVQQRYTWGGAFKKLDEIIAGLVETRAKDEADKLTQRRVDVHTSTRFGSDGGHAAVGQIDAVTSVIDAKLFGAAVAQIAELMKTVLGDNSDLDIRRSKAIGILSRPAYALALIQQGVKHLPPDELPLEFEDGYPISERFLPAGCAGHTCGTIDVPLERLQPKVSLEVVIEADAIAADTVCRVDDAVTIATETLATVLEGKTVQVRPVIDLPRLPDEDQYRPSLAMRRALRTRWRYEAFPFSTTLAQDCQSDHVKRYAWNGKLLQTGLKKMIPLSSRVHRVKTACFWLVVMQPERAHPIWTSPLGYEYLVTPYGTEPVIPPRHYRRLEKQRRERLALAS
ncbi:MAG: hypothetical protein Q4G35_09685 [Propionibacteriaceae bacterium]|nr:hypothetical protein [Propionibacteriaceae bacterium]